MGEQNKNEGKNKKTQHEGYGKASFVIALISIAWQVFWIASVMNAEGLEMAWPPVWAMVFCVPLPLIVIGIILGVTGFRGKGRIYSILGVILNCITGIPMIRVLLLFSSV